MKTILCSLFAILVLQSCASVQSPIKDAVNNPNRTAEEKKADDYRHPTELLEFSKVKAGDTVVDFFPGKGYFTKLFSNLVGANGHVIAHVPKEVENAKFKPVEFANEAAKGLSNVEVKVVPMNVAPGMDVDVVWTALNYHDLHIKSFIDTDVAAFNKLVFKMIKPGGYFVIVDHVATSGSGMDVIEKLHRIDPQQVKKEVEAAGFVFDGESKVLSRDEDHSKNVFDPAIRSKTDQFIYRFKKPN